MKEVAGDLRERKRRERTVVLDYSSNRRTAQSTNWWLNWWRNSTTCQLFEARSNNTVKYRLFKHTSKARYSKTGKSTFILCLSFFDFKCITKPASDPVKVPRNLEDMFGDTRETAVGKKVATNTRNKEGTSNKREKERWWECQILEGGNQSRESGRWARMIMEITKWTAVNEDTNKGQYVSAKGLCRDSIGCGTPEEQVNRSWDARAL